MSHAPERILTTHVGSLPRPDGLLALLRARANAESVDPASLHSAIRAAVMDTVARQVAIGIDIISDGEMSKPSYATYVGERLTGFAGEFHGHAAQDLLDFRDYARHLVATGGVIPKAGGACCRGPVHPKDAKPLNEDLDNLRAAVDRSQPVGAFVNAASPGVVAVFQKNEFYPTEDAYIEAVADALQGEYEAIVEAGFMLQIDSPDLAMGRHLSFAQLDDVSFLRIARRNVEALNHATRNIPPHLMRMHVCWGNYPGPHHRDIDLAHIAPIVFSARPAGLLLESANPRHEHEWVVFRDLRLPDDKLLIPGVVDSTSNYIEHPELVAQRITRYADVVGRDRVLAGTDCGFSTFSGYPTVHPEIAWAKLGSLVEGARIASRRVWGADHLTASPDYPKTLGST